LAPIIAISIASFKPGLSEESPNSLNQSSETDAGKIPNPSELPTVDEARRQAEILHKAMNSTLRLVHDRYYRADQGLPIPASVLKEVFTEMEQEHQVRLRWLAVEGQAMNVDHKPQTSFENEAVVALKSGQKEFEQTANGVYRRAGAITLSNHCLKCHVPDRKNTRDRSAGLIIAIPIREK
jgi:hypothetical protein